MTVGGQHIITMDAMGLLYMWDVQQGLITSTCRGHNPDYRNTSSRSSKPRDRDQRTGTMCVLRTRRVLSVVRNQFLLWCPASQTYTQFGVDSLFEREHITLLRGAQHTNDLVAVGTIRGLVATIDLQQKQVLHKFRGHDKRITSLDWMTLLPVIVRDKPKPAASAPPAERPQLKATTQTKAQEEKARGKLVPIVETDDVFDIYDFDDGADQFGVVSKPTFSTEEQEAESERLRILSVEEKSVGNQNFDFVEACQSLKDEILQQGEETGVVPKKKDSSDESEDSVSSDFEKLQLIDKNTVGATEAALTAAAVMVNSTDDSFVNVTVEKPKALSEVAAVVKSNAAVEPVEKELFLVSGSMEPVVWIWNIKTGAAVQKIELKRAGKTSAIPGTSI